MNKSLLRVIGAFVLVFNLALIGRYGLSTVDTLFLTFGFAIGYEWLIVGKLSKPDATQAQKAVAALFALAFVSAAVMAIQSGPPGASPAQAEPIVDRGTFGCPTGYVDHPADPSKCVLPVVAERIMERIRR